MREPDQLTRDMGNHLYARMRVLLADTAETCAAGDMSAHDIMSLLISILLSETVRGAIAIGMTEDDFLKVCMLAYRKMVEDTKKSRRKRK